MSFKVGRFQLENLVQNKIPFLFWDLRPEPLQLDELAHILKQARVTTFASLLADTQALAPAPHSPIILLCEDATAAEKARAELEGVGFINVYIADGL